MGSEAASNHSFGRLRSGQLLWFTAYKPGERKMGRLKERITCIIESYNRNCRFCITVFFRRKSDSTTFNVLSFVRPSFCHQNPSHILKSIILLYIKKNLSTSTINITIFIYHPNHLLQDFHLFILRL